MLKSKKNKAKDSKIPVLFRCEQRLNKRLAKKLKYFKKHDTRIGWNKSLMINTAIDMFLNHSGI